MIAVDLLQANRQAHFSICWSEKMPRKFKYDLFTLIYCLFQEHDKGQIQQAA